MVDLNLTPLGEGVDLNHPPLIEEDEEQRLELLETLDSVPVPLPTFDYFFTPPPQLTESLGPPMIPFQNDYFYNHQPYFGTDVSSSGSVNFFPQDYGSNEIGLNNQWVDLGRSDYCIDSVDSLMFDVFGVNFPASRDELFEEAIGMMMDAEEEEEIMLENERTEQELNAVPESFYPENTQSELGFEGVLLGELVEDEDEDYQGVGNPSATHFIENLPSVVLTQEHIEKNNICAICTDEFFIKEKVTLLPCSHYFHGNCILPWLNIGNTCPFCRYEFPTDRS
ncbi:zinc finger protein [Macleaya cordata]|uniref:RING-type E3 ubiquitin transferase n=1 Tax=Macleaya cordata TaxID=56857 RepID=A0A200QIE9_MACCD|nr:zinc finger protein [Macleaya cordata]